MSKQIQTEIKLWLRLAVRMTFFAIMLMWPAGSWYWWESWALVALWTGYGLVVMPYLIRHDPELLAERLKLVPLHKDQKNWDKVIMLVFLIAGISLYIIPGFDVVRYQWSEPFPVWIEITAMIMHIPCFLLLNWIMRENTYLSQVVKIDNSRGHKVITTGPYALVRHPMYTVIIILFYVVPVALGSRYALLIALFLTVLLIIRTYLEDRTLYAELEGYPEYAQQTPYRLIPKVW